MTPEEDTPKYTFITADLSKVKTEYELWTNGEQFPLEPKWIPSRIRKLV